ncbi:MAG: peptidoglycan DD-metalloendopeptidase family protein [Ruminococcus sp.]|nr:peptidoglycan DD-metalloendopeptidase family protein [Ruminococcus sp.]
MKKQRKSILSVVLVLTLCMGMVQGVQATTIDEAEKKADALESEKAAAEAEKSALAKELNTVITEMNETQEKLDAKKVEIKEAENELIQAKVDENTQYQSMKKRIKYMYEHGNADFIEILMASESIGDFLNKADYITQLSEYDRNMLVEFQNVVKQVEEKEETLKKEQEEISALRDKLLVKQDEVQALLDSKELEISDLEKQIGENAALLQELIEQAEEEKRVQEEAAKAAAQKQNNSSGGSSGGGTTSYVPPTSSNVVSGGGQFTNPCPGAYVSSTFGYRTFDNSFHNGLDLAAAAGTPTYAAASGRVLYACWSDSAGNWVVIDHGNGFVTKYMHHTALCVSAGEYVSQGQQIGTVGNTGYSFGAHLHFQIELNGTPVDPQAYL